MSESTQPAGSKEDSSSITSPHDRFVKAYFGDPQTAIGMLEVQLPEDLLPNLELEKLAVEKSHFVDDKLRELESALLFRIPRSDRDDSHAYVYVL